LAHSLLLDLERRHPGLELRLAAGNGQSFCVTLARNLRNSGGNAKCSESDSNNPLRFDYRCMSGRIEFYADKDE
jgi:hypothetical protein